MSKIKYGLRNVHYSIVTETTVNGVTSSSYSAVKAWPGAVNISLSAEGSDDPFYADDSVYAMLSSNNGYSGDFESALIPEDVKIAALGMTKDANGVISENKDNVKKYIALMFEFQLDDSGRRYLFYRCMLSRPSVEGSTKADSVEAKTDTITITVSPRPDDGKVQDSVDKGSAAYTNWYNAVYSGGSVVPAIEIQPQLVNIKAGDTFDVTSYVTPAGSTVTWTSSNDEVASVAAGVITGESAGNCIITASITESGVTYSSTLTVVVSAA